MGCYPEKTCCCPAQPCNCTPIPPPAPIVCPVPPVASGPGLDVLVFQFMFPEFNLSCSTIVCTFINLINYGYKFVQQGINSTAILDPYYFLVAHLVATSTNQFTGTVAGPAGSYLPEGQTAGLVSASFQTVQGLSADQSFMLSTRYGQVFWVFTKQQYVQNFYLNVPFQNYGYGTRYFI